MVALTVSRTRLLPQMCAMEVERVISTVLFFDTSQSHPSVVAVHSPDDLVMVVPMLEVALTENVASALLSFLSVTSQVPMCFSVSLLGFVPTAISKSAGFIAFCAAADSFASSDMAKATGCEICPGFSACAATGAVSEIS